MAHGADLRRVTVKIVRSSPETNGISWGWLLKKDFVGIDLASGCERKGCIGLEKMNL